MNSFRMQVLKRIEAEETFGLITKAHRQLAGLPKEHCFDATMIATRGMAPTFRIATVLVKRCIPGGDYQQTKGRHSEQRVPTGKIKGFMDLTGNKIDLKPMPTFEQMKRVSARTSWIMSQKPLPSF